MKYRKIMTWIAALAMLGMTITPFAVSAEEDTDAAVLAEDDGFAPSGLSSEELYAPTIEAVRTRLTEGFSNYQEEDTVYGVLLNNPEAFSYLWYLDPTLTVDNTGYAIFDLDGDGMDELVLGTLDEDGNGTIFDLYTQYEDNVYHIASAGERDHFALTNRGQIIEEGAESAFVIDTIFYGIGRNRLEVSAGFRFDSETDTNYTIDTYQDNEDGSTYEFTWTETAETAVAFSYQNIKLTAFSAEPDPTDDTAEPEYDYISELVCYITEQDYEAKTGTAPAASTCESTDDASVRIVTLTDADGTVLDVYTVNTMTGIGTNQAGEERNLSVYIPENDESEYFVESQYLSAVARKYYMEQHDDRPVSSEMLADVRTGNVILTLYTEIGTVMEKYTIDPTTGIGTDSAGNAVDMSAYAGYKPITEEDFAVPVSILDDAAKAYYNEQNGRETAWVTISGDLDVPVCTIILQDDDDNVLETYTIDPTTGIGTDSKGAAVDFADYVKTHEIVDNDPIYEPDEIEEIGFFATTDEILEFAKRDVTEKTGIETSGCAYGYDAETKSFNIDIYDEYGKVLDTYTIDATTGLGTNSNGEAVDLSVYVEHEIVPEYFAPILDIGEMAAVDYEKKTGKSAEVTEYETSVVNGETVLALTLSDEDGETLDVYTISPFTGVGTNEAGEEVNLPQTGNNAPGTAAAAAGALLLTVSGLAAMAKSGVLRKKEEN